MSYCLAGIPDDGASMSFLVVFRIKGKTVHDLKNVQE